MILVFFFLLRHNINDYTRCLSCMEIVIKKYATSAILSTCVLLTAQDQVAHSTATRLGANVSNRVATVLCVSES